jgi:hypothetical protein
MNDYALIEKIYILDGGLAQIDDSSIYSLGISVGVPMTLSCNAYVIRHRGNWLLWDTGTQDDLVLEPEGRIVAHGICGHGPKDCRVTAQRNRSKTAREQFAAHIYMLVQTSIAVRSSWK